MLSTATLTWEANAKKLEAAREAENRLAKALGLRKKLEGRKTIWKEDAARLNLLLDALHIQRRAKGSVVSVDGIIFALVRSEFSRNKRSYRLGLPARHLGARGSVNGVVSQINICWSEDFADPADTAAQLALVRQKYAHLEKKVTEAKQAEIKERQRKAQEDAEREARQARIAAVRPVNLTAPMAWYDTAGKIAALERQAAREQQARDTRKKLDDARLLRATAAEALNRFIARVGLPPVARCKTVNIDGFLFRVSLRYGHWDQFSIGLPTRDKRAGHRILWESVESASDIACAVDRLRQGVAEEIARGNRSNTPPSETKPALPDEQAEAVNWLEGLISDLRNGYALDIYQQRGLAEALFLSRLNQNN